MQYNSKSQHVYTNNLVNETSPYLLQHAHNPVDWNPWNDAALTQAKKENKLMIVSIGYAACHWCHVMERESFEDSVVAKVMNSNYISIKVDREERPDIDQIYINAVQLMTGNAGWPLNVVTLPDGRPVWGGTYFKKDDWMHALSRIQELYKTNPERLEEQAMQLQEGIKNMDLVPLNTANVDFKNVELDAVVKKWQQSFDPRFGGYKRAPKFMMPSNFEYLLRKAVQEDHDKLLEHVNLTLTQMAYGGLYDAIGGGFSRYSVDEKWHVPHFEKMLYDNAQLVSLYSNAYKYTKNELYKEVIEETLVYIKEEMTTPEGAFYSSLDADSMTEHEELEEGAYYIYTKEELQKLIDVDFEIFKEYYNINSFGKWEGDHYVLIRDLDDATIASNFKISEEVLKEKKASWRKILSEYRNKREKPRLDDKTLTSWNGLMIKGYVDAYKALGTPEYLEAALKNATFIIENQMQPNGALFHNYKQGKSTINGYLEDYAAVIQGYIALYEVTLDFKWIDIANTLANYCFDHFYDTNSGMFYFTSNEDPELVARTFEYRDNVIPASNSIMANNLFVLSHHLDNEMYAKTTQQMLKNVLPEIEAYPSGFSNWMQLLENYRNPFYEVVAAGPNATSMMSALHKKYIPNAMYAGTNLESNKPLLQNRYLDDSTLIYVCQNNTCKLPVKTVEKAIQLLD